jgi:hypothetical protein
MPSSAATYMGCSQAESVLRMSGESGLGKNSLMRSSREDEKHLACGPGIRAPVEARHAKVLRAGLVDGSHPACPAARTLRACADDCLVTRRAR